VANDLEDSLISLFEALAVVRSDLNMVTRSVVFGICILRMKRKKESIVGWKNLSELQLLELNHLPGHRFRFSVAVGATLP
jgi:hypothetical protein